MNTNRKTFQFTQGSGYRIYHDVFDAEACKSVFGQFTLELCFFVFREHAYQLVQKFGLETPNLIADRKKRLELGIADQVIRRNGNPRESKVLKKTGKTSLYASPYIRDGIKRNPHLKNILSEMYGNEKLAFTQGLEPVIYKPTGTGESPIVLDCQLLQPLGPMGSVTNGFHYSGFVCVADGSLKTNDSMNVNSESESTEDEHHPMTNDAEFKKPATLKILENFDVHFENIRALVGPTGPCPLGKQKKQVDITSLESLDINALNAQLKNVYQNQPFRPLAWVDINLKDGDFVVFDCRLPYRTGKVKGSAVMLVPISLRPVSAEWYSSIQHHRLTEGITKGKIGDWSKRTAKGCNLDELNWRTSEAVLTNSRMEHCTNVTSFSREDRLLFGLDRYAL